jgi:hypothetical protein
MRFDPRFHRSFIPGLTYNIRFSIKRTRCVLTLRLLGWVADDRSIAAVMLP